ncbi:hypothetical protein WMY93_005386 [Mugilogobius chulae]|uniref:Uncharacterized protein n=1 Tax=Mugilogobius chulae TaxID=88201 RepID=A0AAW0PT41_9GOBI
MCDDPALLLLPDTSQPGLCDRQSLAPPRVSRDGQPGPGEREREHQGHCLSDGNACGRMEMFDEYDAENEE